MIALRPSSAATSWGPRDPSPSPYEARAILGGAFNTRSGQGAQAAGDLYQLTRRLKSWNAGYAHFRMCHGDGVENPSLG